MKELQNTFDTLDRGKTGLINCDQLQKAMKSLGYQMTRKELQDFIATCDTDGGGKIHFTDFLDLTARQKKDKKIKNAFEMFDSDRNGKIDVYELKDAMKMLGVNLASEKVFEMMMDYDTDDDMKIDFEEFRSLWYNYKVK